LDNFENNLNERTSRFLDQNIKYFYEKLLTELVGNSLLIMTTRFLPSEVELPDRFIELNLGEFSEMSYFKFLFRDDEIKRRDSNHLLSRGLLDDLRARYGAAPKFVQQMREQLRDLDANILSAEIKQAVRGPNTTLAQLLILDKLHDDYCDFVSVERLYGELDERSRNMLSRVAVFNGPITAEAATGIGSGAARWKRRSACLPTGKDQDLFTSSRVRTRACRTCMERFDAGWVGRQGFRMMTGAQHTKRQQSCWSSWQMELDCKVVTRI
jgi:hypothetical protein